MVPPELKKRPITRQNALVDAGYRLLRYTSSHVYGRAEFIAAQVRRALQSPP